MARTPPVTLLFQKLCPQKKHHAGVGGLRSHSANHISYTKQSAITTQKAQSSSFTDVRSEQLKSKGKIIQLAPGLVHIKGALSPSEQRLIVELVLAMGSRPDKGFWNHKKGVKVLNSEPHRGRMYEPIGAFSPKCLDLCRRTLSSAAKADSHLKVVDPTHLILLYYKALQVTPRKGSIPWHQDNGENDGEGDEPVVSFSLGATCDFLLSGSRPRISSKHSFLNPINLEHRISFQSGDAVIFGGPARLNWHAIGDVYPGTTPSFLSDCFEEKVRVNLTFRHTPELCGQEERFTTKSAKELRKLPPDQNPFYNVREMK